MGLMHATDRPDEHRLNFTKKALDLIERMVRKGYIPLDQAADQFALDHLQYRVRPFLNEYQRRRAKTTTRKPRPYDNNNIGNNNKRFLSSLSDERRIGGDAVGSSKKKGRTTRERHQQRQIALKTRIKLIGPDVIRITLEDNNVYRVTHCMSNTRCAIGNESDYIELDLTFGPALNMLIEAYPSTVKVHELPALNPNNNNDNKANNNDNGANGGYGAGDAHDGDLLDPDQQLRFAKLLFEAGVLMVTKW